jgi:hypothetical protein
MQQVLVRTCCSTSPSLPTGTKMENIGSTIQTETWNGKVTHVMIATTNLVIKYFLKMVSSTKVKVGSSYELDYQGSTQNTIRTIQHKKSHTFFQKPNLNSYNMLFFRILNNLPLQQTLTLIIILTCSLVC